ncbi:hypothetical protein GCM10010517_29000 [Streptosporangium fragile]|uniref:Uncharacterized protein n=1 Tax=Streptosporangium fragile TaxID=46186 RepID=A0ABN3VXS7_9ACTN
MTGSRGLDGIQGGRARKPERGQPRVSNPVHTCGVTVRYGPLSSFGAVKNLHGARVPAYTSVCGDEYE